MSDPYQILGIDRGARPEAVKAAYRRLALQYHPDRNPSPDAARQFLRIQRAYEVLSRPDKRRKYDNPVYSSRTSKPYRPTPPKDDRKYGTRHKFADPPPTGAAHKQRYEKHLGDYELFTRSGMRLPRQVWRARFAEIRRESLRNYPWVIALSAGMLIFSISLFFTDERSLFAFNALLLSWLLAYSVITDKAPKSLAERKAKAEFKAGASR